jgi:hypothetical protein
MPNTFIQPFDLKTLYINYFLGSSTLFLIAFVLVISFACALFNISNKVFILILAICSLIMGAYLGQGVYVLVLFLIGFFVYKSFTRLLQ